ncbi:MAG: hypothetical protein A3H49_10075 [Nitrospirae bacterium RIFCSPLOWO2_02_FULL_62_14]|nr:MAG: hypothetical protein A3H49_10075 [Nitrospirae bacterium RIFCSPLOWO2_02_FULL_62_14]OGW68131.1 MAG: hypothetical protein A3A88_00710 [Nitrospirae bacterium RIFCSPLOWO2_01_FULL_62_17]
MILHLVSAVAILLGTISVPVLATAEIQTITVTHTYIMGDRDSKEDARVLCYMTAKRKALDKAGVLIESSSEVKNFQLTKDQVTSYSAAILSIEVVKEEFGFKNGTTNLTMTVKANVDMADVRKRLTEIVADKSLQGKVDVQQQQIRKLEQQLQALNEKLGGAPESSKDEVQKDRSVELAAYVRLNAERGEARAQYHLGLMYLNGKGAPQDHEQAVAWIRRAAEQGFASAEAFLGSMYLEGFGLPQDYAQALVWLRKGAEKGNAYAQLKLGQMYLMGWGVLQDDAQVFRWWMTAAEAGDMFAQFQLASLYFTGKGVPKDDTQAFRWYVKAAEAGHGDAEFQLGWTYETGYGVTKDYQRALRWYTKAAEAGHAQSQGTLGWWYESGTVVPQDNGQAFRWYTKASEAGNAYAQGNLGLMYYNGKGVTQDYVQAHKWFNIAAATETDKGKREGYIKNRDRVARMMTAQQIAEAQQLAREWKPKISCSAHPCLWAEMFLDSMIRTF